MRRLVELDRQELQAAAAVYERTDLKNMVAQYDRYDVIYEWLREHNYAPELVSILAAGLSKGWDQGLGAILQVRKSDEHNCMLCSYDEFCISRDRIPIFHPNETCIFLCTDCLKDTKHLIKEALQIHFSKGTILVGQEADSWERAATQLLYI